MKRKRVKPRKKIVIIAGPNGAGKTTFAQSIMTSADPDIRGSLPAMKRAARRARKLAKDTHTPLYVFRQGRVVNLNPASARQGGRRK